MPYHSAPRLRESLDMPGIDVHTHFIPASFPAYRGRGTNVPWPSMAAASCGHAHVMISGKNYRTVPATSWDGVSRIADIDAMGLTRHVLSPMPELLSYWLPAADAQLLARHLNDEMAALVSRHPDRFSALGAVPLQDLDLAVKELEYVMKTLRLSGVEIATHIDGIAIGDVRLAPFFEAAEALDAAVFVHALHPAGRDRIVGAGISEQVICFPGEVALGIASIITGQTLERHPRLRIGFSHGGGAFAMLLPRMQHSWHSVAAMRETVKQPPAAYARKMYYDTLTYSPESLRLVIETFGASQVMIGTDYPFAIRDPDPLGSIARCNCDAATAEALRETNARRFLNLR